MSEFITYTIENKIATVTINNPPMNVLSAKVTQELGQTFKTLEESDKVLAVILTGEGRRAFMAGADIKEFMSKPERNESENVHAVYNYIANLSKPTIAVLNGFTLGGGLELALTCDFRIAEKHAQIGLPEVTLGLLPGGGGTQRLPRLVGSSIAKELMLTGKHLSANEAYDIKLVNKVVSTGEGLVAAHNLANTFTQKSLESMRRIKYLINLSEEKPLSEALKTEEAQFNELFQTEDAKEGIQAFIEKRKPIFKHR